MKPKSLCVSLWFLHCRLLFDSNYLHCKMQSLCLWAASHHFFMVQVLLQPFWEAILAVGHGSTIPLPSKHLKLLKTNSRRVLYFVCFTFGAISINKEWVQHHHKINHFSWPLLIETFQSFIQFVPVNVCTWVMLMDVIEHHRLTSFGCFLVSESNNCLTSIPTKTPCHFIYWYRPSLHEGSGNSCCGQDTCK